MENVEGVVAAEAYVMMRIGPEVKLRAITCVVDCGAITALLMRYIVVLAASAVFSIVPKIV
jgi:hypothetical protein